MSLPLWPKSMSPPEPPVIVSLPAPPKRFARGQGAVRLVQGDGVVAALAEDLDQAGVGDRRRAAENRHRAAVDEELAGGVAADRDRVVEGIAERLRVPALGLKVLVTAMTVILPCQASCLRC